MDNKICKDCNQSKDASAFSKVNNKSGLHTYCKKCAKIRFYKYYEDNKEKLAQKSKDKYWNENREKSLATSRAYHNSHKEDINKRSREYAETHKEEIKIQRRSKKEERNKYDRDYARERCKSDPLFKFKKNIRRSTSEAFSIGKKNKKTLELLGCSLEEAFIYIESLFQPGMTWDNYGPYWHVDHKIPLASASTIEECEKLCHYTNLQPLTAYENIVKGDSLNWVPLNIKPNPDGET